jgi:hypothetical protein
MKNHSAWAMLLCAALGCSESSGDRSEDTSGGDGSSSEDDTSGIPTTTMPSTTTPGTTDPTTTSDATGVTETGTDTGDEPFDFDDAPPDQYTQIDRMGMPEVTTALIASQDDYNHATPEDDVMGTFVPEIVASLGTLHAGLDDDVEALGLTPCLVDTCAGQVTSLVVPDVLRLELSMVPGFPNGRALEDPVVDMMFAMMLLDLEAHDLGTLADLPLNPNENDEAFADEFPYLAEPH